ncbi:MAG: hypothetical protein Q8N18_18550 [Opitutaceae bacterium]|nr:hypothetical protein [Opitutaceae bacterium]
MLKYSYQAEKLSVARSSLMLPHAGGAAKSIASAFQACSLGFTDMDRKGLNADARRCVKVIEGFMDTTGIEDPKGVGTYELKARKLTEDEQGELSQAVDELAYWFDREAWGSK